MRTNRTLLIIALAALAATLGGSPARADSFNVTLNTSTLSGTQTIAFGLTDGDGVANNTVALSAFSFGGGGAALGSPTYSGSGISGNLNSGITMNDTGFSALFSQQFTVGSSLSFNLTTTNNFAAGTPDSLAMYVCDSTFSNCYSDDTNTAAMLVLNLSGGTLSPSDFILTGASTQGLPAPVVTVSTVPEPSSLLLLTSGLFALGAFARKRMAANAA